MLKSTYRADFDGCAAVCKRAEGLQHPKFITFFFLFKWVPQERRINMSFESLFVPQPPFVLETFVSGFTAWSSERQLAELRSLNEFVDSTDVAPSTRTRVVPMLAQFLRQLFEEPARPKRVEFFAIVVSVFASLCSTKDDPLLNADIGLPRPTTRVYFQIACDLLQSNVAYRNRATMYLVTWLSVNQSVWDSAHMRDRRAPWWPFDAIAQFIELVTEKEHLNSFIDNDLPILQTLVLILPKLAVVDAIPLSSIPNSITLISSTLLSDFISNIPGGPRGLERLLPSVQVVINRRKSHAASEAAAKRRSEEAAQAEQAAALKASERFKRQAAANAAERLRRLPAPTVATVSRPQHAAHDTNASTLAAAEAEAAAERIDRLLHEERGSGEFKRKEYIKHVIMTIDNLASAFKTKQPPRTEHARLELKEARRTLRTCVQTGDASLAPVYKKCTSNEAIQLEKVIARLAEILEPPIKPAQAPRRPPIQPPQPTKVTLSNLRSSDGPGYADRETEQEYLPPKARDTHLR